MKKKLIIITLALFLTTTSMSNIYMPIVEVIVDPGS